MSQIIGKEELLQLEMFFLSDILKIELFEAF